MRVPSLPGMTDSRRPLSRGWVAYDRDPEGYFARYQSTSFESVHAGWLQHLPEAPGTALDVGAGSGRDAAALAARGWNVVAVEPSDALRQRARAGHPSPRLRWLADHLPQLNEVRRSGRSFDLVLVVGVWMHLRQDEARPSMRTLRGLLRPGGLLVVSVKDEPDPKRQQRYVSTEELERLGRDFALRVRPMPPSADAFGRRFGWRTVVFDGSDE